MLRHIHLTKFFSPVP